MGDMFISPSKLRKSKQNPDSLTRIRGFVVLVAGLEPARYLYRGILSPLRLPIPPHELKNKLRTAWYRVFGGATQI